MQPEEIKELLYRLDHEPNADRRWELVQLLRNELTQTLPPRRQERRRYVRIINPDYPGLHPG